LLHVTAWTGIYARGKTNVYMHRNASIHIFTQRKLISWLRLSGTESSWLRKNRNQVFKCHIRILWFTTSA